MLLMLPVLNKIFLSRELLFHEKLIIYVSIHLAYLEFKQKLLVGTEKS